MWLSCGTYRSSLSVLNDDPVLHVVRARLLDDTSLALDQLRGLQLDLDGLVHAQVQLKLLAGVGELQARLRQEDVVQEHVDGTRQELVLRGVFGHGLHVGTCGQDWHGHVRNVNGQVQQDDGDLVKVL